MTEIEHGPAGGVLSVTATSGGQQVTVVGYCRYWHDGDMVGAFNCPAHAEFGGPVAYRWDGARFVREPAAPPNGTTVLEGEWLPDDEWGRR